MAAGGPANGTDVPASRARGKRKGNAADPARSGGRWDLAHSMSPNAW